MATQSFTLGITGPNVTDDSAVLNKLYEAGCSDASFGMREGRAYASFDRDSPTLGDAISSAIEQLEGVDGFKVTRVEEQDLVTMSDIADRASRTRQNIWQMVRGARGSGDFPPPVAQIGDDRSLWRWSDVADWLTARGIQIEGSADRAHVIGAVNAALDARNHMDHVGDDAWIHVLSHLTLRKSCISIGATSPVIRDFAGSEKRMLIDTWTVHSAMAVVIGREKDPDAEDAKPKTSYACAA